MTLIEENFEFLFTTDCLYSRPKIEEDTIKICVRDLGLMKGHPLTGSLPEDLVRIPRSHFIFQHVTSSVRTITPYVGNPRLGHFGKQYTETDGPFTEKLHRREYAFEGRLDVPKAIVDWIVTAGSFILEIP